MLRYGCSPMTPNLVGLTSEKHSSSEGFPSRIRICYGLLVKMLDKHKIVTTNIAANAHKRHVTFEEGHAWRGTWENISTMTTRFLTFVFADENSFSGGE